MKKIKSKARGWKSPTSNFNENMKRNYEKYNNEKYNKKTF